MDSVYQSSRLVLGTVQLGLAYGINNRTGQPSMDQALAIVAEAWKNGIREFDTAQAYGTSEEVLGRVFAALKIGREAKVITKLDPKLGHQNVSDLDQGLQASLKKLGVARLSGLMLHHESQLDVWRQGLGVWFKRQQEKGFLEHVGASVYSPAKAMEALETDGIQFVQVPSNILDRRFDKAGVFRRAKELGKTIYIRSVYLQGLLLMRPQDIEPEMDFSRDSIKILHSLALDLGVSIEELCLGYVLSKWPEAQVVFGAETVEQAAVNAGLQRMEFHRLPLDKIDAAIGDVDEKMLNPVLWPKVK